MGDDIIIRQFRESTGLYYRPHAVHNVQSLQAVPLQHIDLHTSIIESTNSKVKHSWRVFIYNGHLVCGYMITSRKGIRDFFHYPGYFDTDPLINAAYTTTLHQHIQELSDTYYPPNLGIPL